MINSTLGGLIKDYRLQKGISQLDIAFALGWKEPSRLSRIEQGKSDKPPRELLDKIIKALGLEEEEKNTLLLTAGYLPTIDEILRIKEETAPILEQWKYPAVIIDFSWRLIDQNNHFSKVTQLPEYLREDIYKSEVRVLNLLFNESTDSIYGSLVKDQESDLMSFLKHVTLNFKYEQRNRKKEKWYVDHVKSLMDRELFREIWVELSSINMQHTLLGKYTLKSFINPDDNKKKLMFYMFIVPILKDPRFEAELFVPLDLETYKYYQNK